MRLLLFTSRVALLCNLCFAICLVMRYVGDNRVNDKINTNYQGFTGTVIVLGFAAVLLNIFLTISLVIQLLRGKTIAIPVWLRITNFLFFVVQILFFL